MRDRRVQIEMIDLLAIPAAGPASTGSPDVVAEWFDKVIAELDRGPLLVH